MLYVFWAIIFVAAFIYFVYVVIVGGTLVKQKLGLMAAVVFVGGLLSFAGNSNHNNQQQTTKINGIEKWTFAAEDTLEKGTLWVNWINVDSNILNKYRFMYTCGLEKQTHKHIAVSASVTTIGWVLGTTLDTDRIELKTTDDNEQVKYNIYGTVNWHLLGFVVYRQSKIYTGLAPIINHH